MAKDNTVMILILVVVGFLVFQNQGGTTTTTTTTTADNGDICSVVDPSVSFTAQRMFLAGTAVTADGVRVIKLNGGNMKDLGIQSLNSGTISVAPNAQYKFYWGENSTTRYTNVETYTAKCQEAVDDRDSELCTWDATPTVTVYDENGAAQGTTTYNTQPIGTDETVNMEVRVKPGADTCYGNPGAPIGNLICFNYSTAVFSNVETNMPSKGAPLNISSANNNNGVALKCFEFPLVADLGGEYIAVTVTTASGVNPTGDSNITILTKDVGFDLNADTLEEIWGYEDEDNNAIGATRQVNAVTMGFS